jgi:UDP-perosamine 4-acetyltransferase
MTLEASDSAWHDMTASRVVVIGAGGHAAVVIEALRAQCIFMIVGVIDPHPAHPDVLGVPVLGGDDCLPGLLQDGIDAAVVAIGDNRLRQKIGQMLIAKGYRLPPVIHPLASISPSAVIEEGAVIMNRAVAGTRVRIGCLAILNTGSIVDHDCVIDGAAHVAPGVALAGNVRVGERTLIGVGSSVRPGVWIGADVTVGAGSAVVTDIGDGLVVAGAPARRLNRPKMSP